MSQNTCYRCGNSQFRADRALAGRLICSVCGTPAGIRPHKKSKIGLAAVRSQKLRFLCYLLFGGFIIWIFSILAS